MTDPKEKIPVDAEDVFPTHKKDVHAHEDISVHEAQKWMADQLSLKGCKCLACGQDVRMYSRYIYSAPAAGLIYLYRAATSDYVHTPELFRKQGLSASQGGDFCKLRYWDLIEGYVKRKGDDNPRNGYWRLTDKGRAFVLNEIRIPRVAFLYNKTLIGFGIDDINIHEALGKDFDYSRTMGYVK